MSHSCKTTPISPEQRLTYTAFFNPIQFALILLTAITWAALGASFVGAIYLVQTGQSPLVVIGCLIIALSTWAFFPRLDTPPPHELCATPETFPAIHAMVEEVATKLNVPMPAVVLTNRYTAGFGRFGYRYHPVLFIGHNLLSVLTHQETSLLLAHELCHVQRSGLSNSRPVRVTRMGLHNLIRVLSLRPLRKTPQVPTILKLPLAPLLGLRYLLQLCRAAEMRVIETEADCIALSHSSPSTMRSLMKKFALEHVPPVQSAYQNATAANKYQAIRHAAARVDQVRFARLWQAILDQQPTRLDMHPTVQQRITQAERNEGVQIRPIITLDTYNRAHAELAQWPVWLEEMEQQLSVPEQNSSRYIRPANRLAASSEF